LNHLVGSGLVAGPKVARFLLDLGNGFIARIARHVMQFLSSQSFGCFLQRTPESQSKQA